MIFPAPLIRGVLVRRYKRFMADVTLEDKTEVTAHCANSGSMLGVNAPGSEVWLSRAANPKRKLAYTWELIRVGQTLVGINTALPNSLAAEAIEAGRIPELSGYATIRREVKYGRNSRIDLLLEGPGKPKCYVEVKNVTLARDGAALFPDAVTERGAKHLAELSDMAAAGHRAVMLYLVQRGDCTRFGIAADIDPAYATALKAARRAGVEVLCRTCSVATDGIEVAGALPLDL